MQHGTAPGRTIYRWFAKFRDDGLLEKINHSLVMAQGLYDAMDIAARNQGKHSLLTGLIQGLCNRQPRLLVVEDVHSKTSIGPMRRRWSTSLK